jgi:DNA-binding MarR family transcriptional regulator
MERSGLLRRERFSRDARKWRIRMTKEGRRRFYLVLRRLQRRPLQRLFESVVRPLLYEDDHAMRIQLSGYVDVVRSAARRLGDRSTFDHPDWLWFLD